MEQIPTYEEVADYAQKREFISNPKAFYEKCQRSNWHVNGQPVYNWKALFNAYERNAKKNRQPVTEPDADEEDIAALIADIKRLQAINQKQIDDYRPQLLRDAGLTKEDL